MKFCAFLRGVNVKGTSMKMAEVCKVFTEAGMNNVLSVLASGNIIFSSEKEPAELKKILEHALGSYFNYDAFLFVKDEKQVEEIWRDNPFSKSADHHIYIFIGNSDIEKTLDEEFKNASPRADDEQAETVKHNFYWQVPKGNTLESTFGKVLGKKYLKDQMTSRNINTIEKILKKF